MKRVGCHRQAIFSQSSGIGLEGRGCQKFGFWLARRVAVLVQVVEMVLGANAFLP
jgi:hypothetical protein